MMEKRERRTALLGILLIIIVIFKPLRNIIMWLIFSKGDLRFMWLNWYPVAMGFEDYPSIGIALENLYGILPIYQAKLISTLIVLIKTYLPVLCKLALVVSGVGFFFKKNIFRRVSIISLTTLLALGAFELILLVVYTKQFHIDTLLTLTLFAWIIYYLTRPKVKERFNK